MLGIDCQRFISFGFLVYFQFLLSSQTGFKPREKDRHREKEMYVLEEKDILLEKLKTECSVDFLVLY